MALTNGRRTLLVNEGAALAQDPSARYSPDTPDISAPYAEYAEYAVEDHDTGPSLPIILISAACGIAGGIVALYITYSALAWDVPVSVFFAVLGMSLGLGATGATLSMLTGSKAAIANIVFSCGLVAATAAFFGLCMLVGALGATLLLIQ
jgi:hypothetical protein